MATCNQCGGEIEFRYVGGAVTPIHTSGGGCFPESGASSRSGVRVGPSLRSSYNCLESYLNPNAHCPVCGKQVYFFGCPNGGRVFFDDVGWPWPKHGCTNKAEAQRGDVTPTDHRFQRTFFYDQKRKSLEIYLMESCTLDGDFVRIKFRDPNVSRAFRAVVPISDLAQLDLTIVDLEEAPSFVVGTYDLHRTISFISSRLRIIVSFEAERIQKSATK